MTKHHRRQRLCPQIAYHVISYIFYNRNRSNRGQAWIACCPRRRRRFPSQTASRVRSRGAREPRGHSAGAWTKRTPKPGRTGSICSRLLHVIRYIRVSHRGRARASGARRLRKSRGVPVSRSCCTLPAQLHCKRVPRLRYFSGWADLSRIVAIFCALSLFNLQHPMLYKSIRGLRNNSREIV